MRVWRICRAPYAADALAGRGGLVTSGRWHTRGKPIVYTAQSLALAALEVLVHVDKLTVPPDLVQVEVDVPDDLLIERLDVAKLPRDWRRYPAPAMLRRLGDAWLAAGATPVLRVPSSVITEESNFLLNPAHPDAVRITVMGTRRFAYDARLMG